VRLRERGFLRAAPTLILVAGLAAVFACLALIAIIFVAGRGSPLNPVEAFILRVQLAGRAADINRPLGTDPAPVCFVVNRGDSAGVIAEKLAANGFALDVDLFRTYVRYIGLDSRLQAGTFSLQRTLSLAQLAQRLTDADTGAVTFRIWEGWRAEEIAAALDQTPGLTFTGRDFLNAISAGAAMQPGYIGDFARRTGIPSGRGLEGFLFPDTYQLPGCATLDDFMQRVLANFDGRVTDEIRAQLRTLSLYEAITLASIVQREALFDDERPLIAGVYLNRLLSQGISGVPDKLDADPTVQYAIGNTRNPSTWWPPLTRDDYYGIKSPFNTYLNRGLPPTPISNPGLASILAVVNPQPSQYYYFRACPNGGGRHVFSVTLAEHSAACG
jgi:UPF0755 protein